MDHLSYFDLSPFCILLIELNYNFSIIKYNNILFIIIMIIYWLGCDRPSGLFIFVPALLLAILTPLFLPSSSVSLSYFVRAFLMRECSGKHSRMSSPFPIAMLNGTFFFRKWIYKCTMCIRSEKLEIVVH